MAVPSAVARRGRRDGLVEATPPRLSRKRLHPARVSPILTVKFQDFKPSFRTANEQVVCGGSAGRAWGAVGGRGAARQLADQRQQFPAQRRELCKTHFIPHERNARFPPAEHAVSSRPSSQHLSASTSSHGIGYLAAAAADSGCDM
jgi:hypothetical protein